MHAKKGLPFMGSYALLYPLKTLEKMKNEKKNDYDEEERRNSKPIVFKKNIECQVQRQNLHEIK